MTASKKPAPIVLGRDAILNVEDLPLTEVDVPEWGGVVYVKPMTASERDAFEAAVSDLEGNVDRKNFRAKLVARCAVDPATGERVFRDDDVKALGLKNALPLSRVFDAAAAASGLSPEDVAGLEGNSDGREGDSSSD